jgi:hypothetical protein
LALLEANQRLLRHEREDMDAVLTGEVAYPSGHVNAAGKSQRRKQSDEGADAFHLVTANAAVQPERGFARSAATACWAPHLLVPLAFLANRPLRT